MKTFDGSGGRIVFVEMLQLQGQMIWWQGGLNLVAALEGNFSRRKEMSEETKYCIDCIYYEAKKTLGTNHYKPNMCLNTFNIVTKEAGYLSCSSERDVGSCGKEGKNFKLK